MLLRETEFAATWDDESDEDLNSEEQYSSSVADDESSRFQILMQRLTTFVRCLVDLGAALECPAKDPAFLNKAGEVDAATITLPHRPYAKGVGESAPLAPAQVTDDLSQANLERQQRTTDPLSQPATGDEAFAESRDSVLESDAPTATDRIKTAPSDASRVTNDISPFGSFGSGRATEARKPLPMSTEEEKQTEPQRNDTQVPLQPEKTSVRSHLSRLSPNSPKNAASLSFIRHQELPTKGTPIPEQSPTGRTTQQRYVVNPNAQGGHEHHLKGNRRQEALMDTWKTRLGQRKSELGYKPEDNLSLGDPLRVLGSADTLNPGKDPLASDQKGGPDATTAFTEKYGICQEVIGGGAFSTVRMSHKKVGDGEKLFAVKEHQRRPQETKKEYGRRLTTTFALSSSLRHPNVIHTLDVLKDSRNGYLEVMEYHPGGDLYTLILAVAKLEVGEADCYFKQLMRGVEYIHEMGVAHRDLRPENILLTADGAIKISNFGNGVAFRMAWETEARMVSGLCGSGPYIAPEMYVDQEFDARAVDVWACGIIYMAMRTGRHLWRVSKKDEDEFYGRYLEGRRTEEGYGPIESLHRVNLEPPPINLTY